MRKISPSLLSLPVLLFATRAAAGGALFNAPTALPSACGGGDGCWTNYLRVTDLDGDHQLDIVTVNMQGLFSVGAGEPLVVYRNDPPGAFDNYSSEALDGHEGQHRQVAIGDVDGDGDPDIYAPHANGGSDSLFLNDGTAIFAETTIDMGSQAGAARLGDLDDDGDLDLFLTDSYPDTSGPISPAGRVLLNDGAGVFAELADAVPAMLEGNQPIDVDLFDADGDFDLDALIDTHQGPLGLWLNEGDGTFVDASDGLVGSSGNHYGPAACDVDGDGDLDFWVDNAGPDYTEQLHINDGSGVFADETAARVSGNPGSDDNGVVCVDLDHDGDFDAIVVALGTAERYLENDGAGNFTYVAAAIPGSGDSSLWAELGDLDNDGRIDMVTGSGEGATIDRFYIGSDAQVVDVTGPGFRAIEAVAGPVAVDTPVLIHYAVTDSAVTDEGPRLDRAFVRVVVDDGEATEVDATFSGGDLFRAELPGQANGVTVAYSVCAVDWAGNESCAEPLEYDVGEAGDSSGGADSGADDTMGENGSVDDSGSASATVSASGATASATNGDSEAGSGEGGSGQGEDGGGGGCGCTTTPGPAGLAWLGLVLGLARRRR